MMWKWPLTLPEVCSEHEKASVSWLFLWLAYGNGIRHCRTTVGAGKPANQATRWMAPAAPVFAGMPAPTGKDRFTAGTA
ncbi:hypothetical protein FCH83_12145 [Pseudomonas putida]|nr:hypothetical protein [Pseudomonas putida]NTZ03961.1 hypothetical protein [Pseudomonas putida]NTZ24756.1 hypothetical protein [Pseudomonas putida]NTZ57272.1 hypothetical protein [Pseudomonas putida]NTZ68187.1 hypothetical protein [Pseudomonas putida]